MRSLTSVTPDPARPDETPPPAGPLAESMTVAATARGESARNRAAAIAALLSFVWLAVAAAAIYLVVRYLPPERVTLTGLAGLAAGVTAPLTAIWLVALTFARAIPGDSRSAAARIAAAEARFVEIAARTRREIDAMDGVLSTLALRVESLRDSVGGQAAALLETAGQMEWRSAAVSSALGRDREAIDALLERLSAGSGAARAQLGQIIEALPAAERQALTIDASLRASVEGGQRLHEVLAAADAAGSAAAERLDARAKALGPGIDAAMARAAEALEASRAGVTAQVEAVIAATEQAHHILGGMTGETAEAVAARLATLSTEAERLAAALTAQRSGSVALVDSVERGFSVLDAKLANAAQVSDATLGRLDARLAEVRGQIHELASPLGATSERTREIEAAVTALTAATGAALDQLTTAVPDGVAATGGAIDDIRAAVAGLRSDVEQAVLTAENAVAPVAAGRDALADVGDGLTAQQAALTATVAAIGERLGAAKALLAEIESSADATVISAPAKLIEALTRVREVAAQAEGSVREALDRAVADARQSLAIAGDETLQTAFAAPVAAKLDELRGASVAGADAGRLAAERLSAQLFSVLEAASAVEQRIGETDAKLDAVSRDDLARRSALLIDALNSASIDIAKALATELPDTAWAAYLRGDKSVFTRRAVRLLDGGAAKAVARRFESEPEFRDAVRRYVHDFETLMRRVGDEREGNGLQIALLSSDTGKLYVALAQALERIRG